MAELEQALAQSQNRVLLLCSPHNPTGKVWRREELQALAGDVRRYQQRLWWVKRVPGQSESLLTWQDIASPLMLPVGLGRLRLSNGGELRPPRDDEAVSVRFKAPGKVHIVGRNGGRKLKKIWQELGVAPWHRDTTPLLFYDETLIAAAGEFITREGQARETPGLTLRWERNGQRR